MGGNYSNYDDIVKPNVTPKWREGATFDAQYGFEQNRVERKMIATHEELSAAKVEKRFRDYCSHHLIDFYKCRRENFPWVLSCKPEMQKWEKCQYEDFILRMKEYEREHRLLERTQRKVQKSSVEVQLGA